MTSKALSIQSIEVTQRFLNFVEPTKKQCLSLGKFHKLIFANLLDATQIPLQHSIGAAVHHLDHKMSPVSTALKSLLNIRTYSWGNTHQPGMIL